MSDVATGEAAALRGVTASLPAAAADPIVGAADVGATLYLQAAENLYCIREQ